MKKFIAILLALMLCVSVVGTAAFADDDAAKADFPDKDSLMVFINTCLKEMDEGETIEPEFGGTMTRLDDNTFYLEDPEGDPDNGIYSTADIITVESGVIQLFEIMFLEDGAAFMNISSIDAEGNFNELYVTDTYVDADTAWNISVFDEDYEMTSRISDWGADYIYKLTALYDEDGDGVLYSEAKITYDDEDSCTVYADAGTEDDVQVSEVEFFFYDGEINATVYDAINDIYSSYDYVYTGDGLDDESIAVITVSGEYIDQLGADMMIDDMMVDDEDMDEFEKVTDEMADSSEIIAEKQSVGMDKEDVEEDVEEELEAISFADVREYLEYAFDELEVGDEMDAILGEGTVLKTSDNTLYIANDDIDFITDGGSAETIVVAAGEVYEFYERVVREDGSVVSVIGSIDDEGGMEILYASTDVDDAEDVIEFPSVDALITTEVEENEDGSVAKTQTVEFAGRTVLTTDTTISGETGYKTVKGTSVLADGSYASYVTFTGLGDGKMVTVEDYINDVFYVIYESDDVVTSVVFD